MPLRMTWRTSTSLSIEAECFRPEALAILSNAQIERLPIQAGNSRVALGDLFRIEGSAGDGHLVLEGDLRHVRGIGQGMTSGTLSIVGDVGGQLGSGMSGGTIEVEGNVGDWAGAEMSGGMLRIRGTAGRFLGAAYPGSRLGMREGVILVEGSVGDDAGLAMRR